MRPSIRYYINRSNKPTMNNTSDFIQATLEATLLRLQSEDTHIEDIIEEEATIVIEEMAGLPIFDDEGQELYEEIQEKVLAMAM